MPLLETSSSRPVCAPTLSARAVQRILIVDDEPDVLGNLANLLGHAGYEVVTSSTLAAASGALAKGPFHLVLTDLTPTGVFGQEAELRLEEVGITVNRNAIPFDTRKPMDPSGLRIGTPALTTRGLVEGDMTEIAEVIAATLGDDFESAKSDLLDRSKALMEKYPLYPQLSAAAV